MSRRRGSSSGRKAINDRKQRGLVQPILLLDYERLSSNTGLQFLIAGTTSNYTVQYDLELQWQCTCPDFERRQTFCKHIYFVLARVLQKDLIGEEIDHKSCRYADIDELYHAVRSRVQHIGRIGNPDAEVKDEPDNNQQDERKRNTIQQRQYVGDPCCICFEDMTSTCITVYCKEECGKSVHRECFRRYTQIAKKQKRESTCPYCRSAMSLSYVGDLIKKNTDEKKGGNSGENESEKKVLPKTPDESKK